MHRSQIERSLCYVPGHTEVVPLRGMQVSLAMACAPRRNDAGLAAAELALAAEAAQVERSPCNVHAIQRLSPCAACE